MRPLDKIILHSTATTVKHKLDVAEIRRWHVKGRGWSDIGYHFVILQDGTIQRGRDIRKVGAHALNNNATSIGVAYCGGVDSEKKAKDTMTKAQETAFRQLVWSLRTIFGDLAIIGHNDVSTTSCPSFKVKDKFADLIQ